MTTLNPDDVVRVQKSFRDVVPIAHAVGTMFYARLFETHPEVRDLFAEDIELQAGKLIRMLALVVNSLHRLEEIQPTVETLARRHAAYGVVAAHYAIVGDALVWTLQKGLGERFTTRTRHAWIRAYGALAEIMITASSSDRRYVGRSTDHSPPWRRAEARPILTEPPAARRGSPHKRPAP